MNKMTKLLSLFTLCAVCVGIMTARAAAAPKKLSFIPLWSPQAQFAGYYVAQEKGFYRNSGLDVDIITGGPSHPADVLLEKEYRDAVAL